MEEGPQELPGDRVERELEVRVLERRVVAGLVGRPRDAVALLDALPALLLGEVGSPGDLLGLDDPPGRVAGARRRDGVLVRPRERVDEPDDGLAGQDGGEGDHGNLEAGGQGSRAGRRPRARPWTRPRAAARVTAGS